MKRSNTHTTSIRVLAALTLTFISLAGLPGRAEAATCLTCHAAVGSTTDIRPVESTYRNITSGSIRGSHAKHIPTPTLDANTCTPCHGTAVASYQANHRDGFINVTSAAGIGYSKKTTFPQSGSKDLVLGTCSAASCHDNGKGMLVTTPTWGASVPACTACHALVPEDGSHTKHVTGTLYKKALCADCHTGYVQGATAAASHLNGTIDVNAGGYPSPKAKGSAPASCSTSYCHSSGQSADGLSATPVYSTVTWGSTVTCGSCHATSGLATGTHAKHIAAAPQCNYCHATSSDNSYNSTLHVNGQIDVTDQGYSAGGTPGNGYGTCSTAACHGSIAPPVWGVNTNNTTCTKCHGTGTVDPITSDNRHVVAPADPAATDKGQVSATAKTGAHQTHIRYLNGLSGQGNEDDRCSTCHGALPTSGLHVTQFGPPSNPTSTFSGLAKTSTGGTMTPVYSAGSCSNTYCHNPAGTNGTLDPLNAGTGTSPSWTNAGYLGDTLKTDANCNACHKSPGNVSFTLTSHNATQMPQGIATDCSSCHGHNGGVGGAVGQQHMDGIRYANGECNSCHGYPPMTAVQLAARTGADFANAKLEDYAGGGGYHSSHLLATVTVADAFTPCLPCHPSTSHRQGGSVLQANVNVNYDANDTNLRFDGSRSKRYDASLTKCSNISCHFKPSPAWKL